MFDGCPSLRSEASALRLKAEAGGSSRRPRHFSLLRQSKVPKRKATRSQGHFVVPCGARARWGLAKLASLKQTRALIHLSLRCSALPHGASGIGCGRACEGALLPLRSGGFALCLKAEAGVAARRPPHFLCFAKESKQRKATRSQGHFVVPCAARARWGLAKLAALKQTRALIHLSLRCSALPHGKGGIGCGRACEGTDEISTGGASSGAGGPVLIVLSRALAPHRAAKQPRPPIETNRRRCAAAAVASRPHPPVGHGEQRRLGRKKGSRLFERSEFSETPPKLSSAADPAQQGVHVGSPFFAYFLWRDKESEAPAGAQSRPPPSNKQQNPQSAAASLTPSTTPHPAEPEKHPC